MYNNVIIFKCLPEITFFFKYVSPPCLSSELLQSSQIYVLSFGLYYPIGSYLTYTFHDLGIVSIEFLKIIFKSLRGRGATCYIRWDIGIVLSFSVKTRRVGIFPLKDVFETFPKTKYIQDGSMFISSLLVFHHHLCD